jgi:hypothetical protein
MRVTDEQLSNWTKPAFGNEEKLADNTEAAIRSAISKHPVLQNLDIRILPKGSYKNNTNIRRDSDIDIAVIHQGLVMLEYTEGSTMAHANLVPYTGISREYYKHAVGEALVKEFGPSVVDKTGNRVFRLRGSSTVMNADVIPATQYWYVGQRWQRKGIELILNKPDAQRHFNYPDQHYDNGVAKNNFTLRRYKRSVRILKNIENKLVSEGLINAIPSFLIECLAYNVPDYIYEKATSWRQLIADICVSIWGYISKELEPPNENRWLEVNGHKYLFGNHQRWGKSDAINFISQTYQLVTS